RLRSGRSAISSRRTNVHWTTRPARRDPDGMFKFTAPLAAAAALSLAACGGSSYSSNSSSSSSTKATTTGASSGGGYGSKSSSKTKASAAASSGASKSGGGEVEMYDNYFQPKTITGKPGQTVKIELKNEGQAQHNFKIDSQLKTADADVKPGAKATVTVKIPTSGSIQFYCEYHKALGMTGTVKAS
ncbi:MAG: cupredoxin domain-containing protein, partial [Thermoleophilaceae bacterium]